MRNKRIVCAALAIFTSVLLSGCKPTIPEDSYVSGTSSASTTINTADVTEKKEEDKATSDEKNIVSNNNEGSFAVPIRTNGDNDDMNSSLDISLTINYGTGGQFYDSEAIYGYLKNKDTLIYDSPMFDIACDYIKQRERGWISSFDALAAFAKKEGYDAEKTKNNYEHFLSEIFPDIDAKAVADRLFGSGSAEFVKKHIQEDENGDYKIKNEEEVYAAIYKSVANYYNAKYFGEDFVAGTTTFEGDPELVYDYTTQHGGIAKAMFNTNDESGFEMSVNTYNAPYFVVTTKYNITGQKSGMRQSFDRIDVFFIVPVSENGTLTFKIDFMMSPTDYIYSYTKNPRYNESMNLIPKEVVVNKEFNCVFFAEN